MTREVKGSAPSPGDRQGQARTRLARAAVIEAAQAVFLERGYGAATIDAISARADVPAATVYRLFSSKLGILKSVLDVSIAGDDRAVALPDRVDVRSLLVEPDARRRVEGFVHFTAQVNARTSPIYRILVSAAASDAGAAALLDELTGQRQRGQGLMAQSLARSGALRTDLRERDAADVIHALMSPELYALVVVDRRWSVARYERWLSGMLVDQLLPPA